MKSSPCHGRTRMKPRLLPFVSCVMATIVLAAIFKSTSQAFALFRLELHVNNYEVPLAQPLSSSSLPEGTNYLDDFIEKRGSEASDIQESHVSVASDLKKQLDSPVVVKTVANFSDVADQTDSPVVPKTIANFSDDADHQAGEAAKLGAAIIAPITTQQDIELAEKPSEIIRDDQNAMTEAKIDMPIADQEKKLTSNASSTGVLAATAMQQKIIHTSTVTCDFSDSRSDICTIDGDVRVVVAAGAAPTLLAVSSSSGFPSQTWKLRPYARKWEAPTMDTIKELTIRSVDDDNGQANVPACTDRHDVPAVVFSTRGFLGNVFHDFTDVLIPLFLATYHLNGHVQFAVSDYNWPWMGKYQPLLRQLSNHPPVNLDADDHLVHCYPSAQIGLESHKPLGIDASRSRHGCTMAEFRALLRKSFSLKRTHADRLPKNSKSKPRLLILLRRGTRRITNAKQVIEMAKAVGFRVIKAWPEATMDVSRFAVVVNSCDVLLGVHGAGLSNMLFLPDNATVFQILPFGDLQNIGRHDYAYPETDMSLRYAEYEATQEESTLKYKYPKDHPVFTDPQSIHRQGWNALYWVYLSEQSVEVDVNRFREVLLQVYRDFKG